MTKYSFRSKNTLEHIKTIDANSLEEAKIIFSNIKVLDLETFDKLYEVDKR